jgi:hypothetical protein
MYSDYEESDLEYTIKTSRVVSDIILLFKTIKCTEINCLYVYLAMANPYMTDFIKDIMTPYINKGYGHSLINFLDGWVDYGWDDKMSSIKKVEIRNMIILFLRTDKIKIDECYIPILYNIFNISYYGELMMG